MKCLNWLITAGVVVAVAIPAGAITFNQSYVGPLKFKFSNYDSGRVYFGPDGTYTADSGPNQLTLADLKNTAWAPGSQYGSIAPPGGVAGEDAWGLFELTTIAGRDPNTGQYNIILWEKGGVNDTRPDIVGIFYGIVDQQVTLTTRTDGLVEQEIWAAGDNFKVDLYEVPNGTALLSGPTARTGVDSFPLWTVGQPILRGIAISDQIVTPPPPASGLKFWSKTILNPSTGDVVSRSTAEGTAKLWLEWYGGTAFSSFSVPGPDMEFTTHVFGNDTSFPWTSNTDDPAYGHFVPEPVTMAALLLATGGLGSYLRRRFTA